MPGGGGHQPYGPAGARPQGPALAAMLAGESSVGNPQDSMRQAQKLSTTVGTEARNAPIRSAILAEFVALHTRPSE